MSVGGGKARSVRIDKIVVGRSRRPLGDLDDLKESIASVGLLHPIVVTSDMRLVAGLHRLRACQALGWDKIPVSVVSLAKLDAELAELDENLARHELTVLQRAEVLQRRKQIHETLYPETRRGVAGGKASGASRRGERTSVTTSLVQVLATRTGRSRRAIEREIQIAADIPKDVRRLLAGTAAEDDKTALLKIARLPKAEQMTVAKRLANGEAGSVRRAMVLDAADGLRGERARFPRGPFKVLVVDPPWAYEARRTDYPTMSVEDICALPVARLAAPDAVLWLWTTNAMMRHAYTCLDAWGFEERTILTWHKTRSTLGAWLLNTTEHAILAVRGRPTVNLTTQTTLLSAANREHSRKPDEFYLMVERLCPSKRRIDLFARESRPGWTTWGAERTRFDGRVKVRR